ncbi:MAG: hypothetical protein PUD63_12105 [Clostridia bacterium]|nr:hypothetical protein [Clostridia bacterium]
MTCMCLTIASAAERAEVGRILIGNGYRVWQQTIRVGGKPRKVLMADVPGDPETKNPSRRLPDAVPEDGMELTTGKR